MSDKNLPTITKGTGIVLSNISKSLKITSKILVSVDRDWQWWLSITNEWKKILLDHIFRNIGNNDWDISSLDNINLESKENMRGNVKKITEMTDFYLRDNYPFDIKGISPLSYLTNLTEIGFGYQEISDISPLKHLINLTELNFYDVILATDFSALKSLKSLKTLGLFFGGYRYGNADENGNEILLDDSVVALVGSLASLEKLYMAQTVITDISPLLKLTRLTELTITDSRIKDISPLENLRNLTALNFGVSQVRDFTSLNNLTNLKELFLYDNQIEDIGFLRNFLSLERLYLEDNRITDISSLSNLLNLESLNLKGNRITDISSLSNLLNLESLNLEENRITEEDIEWLTNQLPECRT